MERVIAASLRGFVCVVTLAGLAACNGDGSGSETAAVGVKHTSPVHPTRPTNPVQPSNPIEPSNPTQPSNSPDASDGNAAPQINGSPASQIVVGHNFNFTPNATDADGDNLTFSVESKPSWASFDSNTGHLWGTPTASDVGSHEDIAISVSDGEHTKTLPQFAVNVVDQADGRLSLSWEPPTENVDGSALTNLKGYKIYYGTSPGNYDQTVTINSAGISRYVIENLAAGTYYIAISAVTTGGTESDLSGEAHKSI